MAPAGKTISDIDIFEKMKALPALESFEENELKELLRHSKSMRFKAGDLIVDERSYDGWVYYLISGRVRILKKDNELAVLQRTGDIFGDMGKMDGRELSVTVSALEDTTCLKIDISNLDGLSSENRFILRYLIYRGFAEVLAKRLRITSEEYVRAQEEIERLKAEPPWITE